MTFDEIILLKNEKEPNKEDKLNEYLWLYYDFCHTFKPGDVDYLVGNLYYSIIEDINIVITHHIEDRVLFVNLLYDVNGKLFDPYCTGYLSSKELLDKTKFEKLGSYFDLTQNDKIALGLYKQREIFVRKIEEIDDRFKHNPSRIFGVITFNRSIRNISEVLTHCIHMKEMTKEKYMEIKEDIKSDLLILCTNNSYMNKYCRKDILDNDKVLSKKIIDMLRFSFKLNFILKTKSKNINGKKQTVYIIEKYTE